MANEFTPASTADAHFNFTKLLVNNLEQAHEFYTQVCGLVEVFRYQSEIDGRAISEICYAPTAAGGASFTLLHYIGNDKPSSDEVILGFTTNDLEEFIARAQAAGGRQRGAIKDMADLQLRVAFVEDCEGHLLEVVQMP